MLRSRPQFPLVLALLLGCGTPGTGPGTADSEDSDGEREWSDGDDTGDEPSYQEELSAGLEEAPRFDRSIYEDGCVVAITWLEDGETIPAGWASYDALERLRYEEKDTDGDGFVDDIKAYEYIDDTGRWVRGLFSYDAEDISAQSVRHWQGPHVVYSAVDDDVVDGAAEQQKWSTFEDGRTVSTEEDTNGDGKADSAEVWTYAEDGLSYLIEVDDTLDGTVDHLLSHEATEVWPGGGWAEMRIVYDYWADSIVDYIFVYTFDEDGRVVEMAYDLDGDGQADILYEYLYEEGLLVEYTYTLNPAGPRDSETTRYSYDSFGRMVLEEREVNPYGEPLWSYAYDWDCD